MSTDPDSITVSTTETTIVLPEVAVCTLGPKKAQILTVAGEVKTLPHGQAGVLLSQKPVMLCHAPYALSKLRAHLLVFDILDLYLFVHPTKFCVPTPHGIAKALQVELAKDAEDAPLMLVECAQTLLTHLQALPPKRQEKLIEIAQIMGMNGKGWPWTPFVCMALGHEYDPQAPLNSRTALNVWKDISEWEDSALPPPPSHMPVEESELEVSLKDILGHDHLSEDRPQQLAYAQAMRHVFSPKDDLEEPNILLAEAGTGTGKTLGYLTPSTLWADKNDGPVWVSTYTKNLQQQISEELSRIYDNPEQKDKKVAIRKGRENYLCLLNFEDAAAAAHLARSPSMPIALGIMARWIMETRAGDFTGTDFPSWAQSLYGYANTTGLSDKRGECLYSACDHYKKCFRETSIRNAAHAKIIIANHALVMIETATANIDQRLPNRTIFDEGHHLFQAADSAFAAHLTARETAELRRWISGNETNQKKRARGLKKRFEDLTTDNAEIEKSLLQLLHHAKALPADGWSRRMGEGQPAGPIETFLSAVLAQIRARTDQEKTFYAQETDIFPLTDQVMKTIPDAMQALEDLKRPMLSLAQAMQKTIEQDEGLLEPDMKRRIDSLSQSIERRANTEIIPWIEMLHALKNGHTPSHYVDWMEIEKNDGRPVDLGIYRHWVDPMKPFATSVLPHTHGLAITSATLKDKEDTEWNNAKLITGANYLSTTPSMFETQSPFDYASQAKVLIINDVNKNSIDQVANAYLSLFKASNGGGLGIFTAIQRLKAVYEKIYGKLGDKDIPLYAQHIDQMDTGTLTDIFREEERSCLLGTDAMRDGVDVPGASLKLMIFDRVPWPRPTLLHKARRKQFGEKSYDEMLTRMKLQQAFGRLIRRQTDKGVFIILDSATPTRLLSAFPQGIEIERIGLQDALKIVKNI